MNFVLLPFQRDPSVPAEITGTITRDRNKLSLAFRYPMLEGVAWPPPASVPTRRDNLWQSTCFECFIGIPGDEHYIECNLSPSGHWQSYQFNQYRTPSSKLPSTRVSLGSMSPESLECSIEVADAHFVTADWQISCAVILQRESGECHYYALAHPTGQPDFHLASCRTLELNAN